MKYVLILNETDAGWEITTTAQWPDVDNNVNYKTAYVTDKDLYDYVGNLLQKGYSLIVTDKSKLGFEGAHITRYDITSEIENQLVSKKNNYLKSEYTKLEETWSIIDTIDLFTFLVCNNKLIEKGIYISELNYETILTDLIDKKDTETIELVKIFLKLYSKFSQLNTKYSEYKNLEKSLATMTEDELDSKIAESN